MKEKWLEEFEGMDNTEKINMLDARLEECESALTAMVQQYNFDGVTKENKCLYSDDFMTAAEEAFAYLTEYGIAERVSGKTHLITFKEV